MVPTKLFHLTNKWWNRFYSFISLISLLYVTHWFLHRLSGRKGSEVLECFFTRNAMLCCKDGITKVRKYVTVSTDTKRRYGESKMCYEDAPSESSCTYHLIKKVRCKKVCLLLTIRISRTHEIICAMSASNKCIYCNT